ncbi:MAG: aminopeptidase [Bacteroidetes bacterium]|nr:MAG: aminopeptidase [Bacteroidota bacterium]
MLFNIFTFELRYRLSRPATYIYFGILFLLAFGAIAWENITVGGGTGQVKENAPLVLANMMLILTAIPGFFLASAIMGVPVLRDFQHATHAMLFTRPIRKLDYLAGRFLGSLLITCLVFSGMVWGLMLGSVMPWLDAEKMLPFHLWHYLQPMLLFVLPNAFIAGSLFFMGGTLSRSMFFVFIQGVILLGFYIVAANLISELDNKTLAALLDPMGLNTTGVVTQYWTVAERNSLLLAPEGLLLANRLIWLGVALLACLLTYWGFSFTTHSKKWFNRRKKRLLQHEAGKAVEISLPEVQQQQGLATYLFQTFHLSLLYLRDMVLSIPFLAITIVGMVILGLEAVQFNSMYGTEVYPVTPLMVQLVSESFTLFFIVIIVVYAGELVWRERDLRMHQIYDTLPFPDFVGLVSKFLAFVYAHVLLLLMLILTGVVIQTFKGFYQYDLGVYFSYMFSETFAFLVLYTLLAMFIQVMVNHKFLGHAFMVLFFIITYFVLDEMGLEHNLFKFASGSLGSYSEMNHYGHFVAPFSWMQLYWLGFAAVLFALSVVFSLRGTDALMRTRIRLARLRFSRPVLAFALVAFLVFSASGCFVYYNTNVLNEYRNSDAQKDLQADYEKTLKQYEYLPQPKIVESKLEVDIYPYQRDFEARGFYYLKNKTPAPISRIHLQYHADPQLHIRSLTFDRPATLVEPHPRFRYYIYELDSALAPGDSLKMQWEVAFETKGFVESGSNTNVVYNGTFFNNTYFPSLGYERSFELSDKDDRKKRGLPERERMRERNDPIGQKINLVGDDADHIRFEIVLSTHPSQIALAPGYLQREWQEHDRRYFHYKMDVPMFNFYSIVSANYEVMREKWTAPDGKDIQLEIYYHKGHAYNLDRMMRGMKKSLAYYSRHFSPYQYRQMRIMEFPRYATFAQSFANTVPFSEGIGFVLDINEEEQDIDMAFYVTAHEMAHQWWGHQVTEAQVKGNAMLSETMSQYSALMVMKHEYPEEIMQKFLAHELDRYLSGRAAEQKKEMPLERVEGQGYIHYRKGSLIMYALQDYIGEDSVNAALRRYVQDWAWREDRYPTTDILLDYFRAVTPDSLQYLITDMFETITLYENRVLNPTYRQLEGGDYEVNIPIRAIKYRADSLGNETPIPINDWIDIGVYARSSQGKDSLIYLQKHKVLADSMHFRVHTKLLPLKAGIDPINKLIDRNPRDNTARVVEMEEG